MVKSYQEADRDGGFDYQLTAIPGHASPLFRGPAIDLTCPYLAFVGAAQTFGRFVERPFPTLLAERLGAPALNLGHGGAGPRFFDHKRYLDLLNRAELVVIQVLSGRSASSSLFDNSGSGKRLGETPLAEGPVHSETFLRRAAEKLSASEFARIIEEMRADYVASFQALIDRIDAPCVLLWLSRRTPDYREDYSQGLPGVLGAFPQLVNAPMVEAVAAHCDAYVECVSSTGLPQPLWRADHAIDGARWVEGRLVNDYYPSPEMHAEAADLLEEPCRRLMRRAAG